jgi:hypothetical protein
MQQMTSYPDNEETAPKTSFSIFSGSTATVTDVAGVAATEAPASLALSPVLGGSDLGGIW